MMSDTDRIAHAFVDARHAARALPDYPGPLPMTLAEGYAIQASAIAYHGGDVAGWKVGRIPDALVERYGANRLAGPIFAAHVVDAAPRPAMPVFAGGFAAAEAEFLLRLADDPDPTKTHFTLEEAALLIGAVHVGIEIASSPYQRINADGPAVTVSDFGNNHGLVVGPEIGRWDEELLDLDVALLIDGAAVGAARARTMLDGPIGAAAFLLGWAASRDIPLRAGQWISSGAVTGVHAVTPGQAVTARFGSDHEIGCTIVAAS